MPEAAAQYAPSPVFPHARSPLFTPDTVLPPRPRLSARMARAYARDPEIRNSASREQALPFVLPGGPGRPDILWAPRPTGDYEFDFDLGERYGEVLLPLLGAPDGADLMRRLMLDIVQHADLARDKGVLAGLMGVLGQVMECAGHAGITDAVADPEARRVF